MKKGLAALALAGICISVQAQTVVDNFSVATPSDYVLPTDPNYGANYSSLSDPLFNSRSIGASNYGGNGTDLFVVHTPGDGTVTTTANGTASGYVNFGYSNGGPVDLSSIGSFTFHVNSLTAPVVGDWGIYSNGYNELAEGGFTITNAGDLTLNLNSLTGTFARSSADSLFVSFGVSAGQSLVLSNLRANAVPEPAGVAVLGLGMLGVASRRRKRA